MESIRIDTGVKKIQINDGPEYIEFNPSDINFVDKYYRIYGELSQQPIDKERLNKIDANTAVDENGTPLNIPDKLEIYREVNNIIRTKIDDLFGKGTSQKVFGDMVSVNMEIYKQFFEGITSFVAPARTQKVAKYQKVPHKKRVMS
jgi:hypothetical protein